LRQIVVVVNMGKMKRPVVGGRNNACYTRQSVIQKGLRGDHAPYEARSSPRLKEKRHRQSLSPHSSVRLLNRALDPQTRHQRIQGVKLSQDFDISRSSVFRIIQKMRKVGSVHDQRKSNPGRPAVFGEQHTSFITNEIEK
jgi:hypothetical protein